MFLKAIGSELLCSVKRHSINMHYIYFEVVLLVDNNSNYQVYIVFTVKRRAFLITILM